MCTHRWPLLFVIVFALSSCSSGVSTQDPPTSPDEARERTIAAFDSLGSEGRDDEVVESIDRYVTWLGELGVDACAVSESLQSIASEAWGHVADPGRLQSSFERAITIHDRCPEADDLGRYGSRALLATYYFNLGRYEEASRAEEDAFAQLDRASTPDETWAAACKNLGDSLLRVSRADEAHRWYMEARETAESDGADDPLFIAQMLSGAAEAARVSGRFEDSASYLDAAMTLIQGHRARLDTLDLVTREVTAAVLFSRGGVAYDRGDYDASLTAMREVLVETAVEPELDPYGYLSTYRAQAFMSLADLAVLQRRTADAFVMVDSIRTLADRTFDVDSPDRAPFLQIIGRVHHARGDVAAALESMDEAESILTVAGQGGWTLLPEVLIDRAQLREEAGDLAGATEDLTRALAVIRQTQIESSATEGRVLAERGRLDVRQGEHGRARESLERALEILERTEVHLNSRADAGAALARVLRAEGRPDEAIGSMERALDDHMVLRGRVSIDPLARARAAARASRDAGDLARWYAEASRPHEAIRVLETLRARSLREQNELRIRLEDTADPAVIAALDRMDEAQLHVTGLGKRRDAVLRDESIGRQERRRRLDEVEASRANAIDDLRRAREAMLRALESTGAVSANPTLAQVSDALSAVGSGQMILYFWVGAERSDLYVVGSGSSAVRHLALTTTGGEPLTRAHARRRVDAVVEAIRGGDEGAFTEAASALREEILPDALASTVLEAETLVLVLDTPLQAVPFESLPIDASGDLLVDRGPVVPRIPSLVTRTGSSRDPRAWSRGATVVAYSNASTEAGARDDDPGQRLRERARLGPLPFAADEARRIADRWTRGPVALLLDSDATEAAVRASLPGRDVVHFATHGLVESRESAVYAELLLHPTPTLGGDGFLSLHEIERLSLDAELVVLSACETNVGASVPGDGVFALSRGFLAAGARRVVGSLWRVDDESTSRLMGAFYEALGEDQSTETGSTVAAALRRAKRQLRADPEFASPYHWAAFVLVGDS